MDILKAFSNDLPKILELQKLCFIENAERYNDFKIAPITETLQEIEKDFQESIILKAVEQSKIAGSVRAYQKEGTCYIGRLVVHPDFQNQGIGKKLMTEIENCFNNVLRYELFTGFQDKKNLYLYDKLGYKQFKRVPVKEDFYLVYMEKRVN